MSNGKPYVSSADRARAAGLCPHNSQPCARARWCIMKRMDACRFLCDNLEASCSRCRKESGGCKFECFRRHQT